jgi:hypothetical protein
VLRDFFSESDGQENIVSNVFGGLGGLGSRMESLHFGNRDGSCEREGME